MSVSLPNPISQDPATDENFRALASAITDYTGLILIGIGNPNGVRAASPPALYLNRSGGVGATLWVKETGVATNTGWAAK